MFISNIMNLILILLVVVITNNKFFSMKSYVGNIL